MCGEDSRDIAGLPVDRFQEAIQPDEAQRAALDDLANASVKAAQDIKTACPTEIALTAPGRLAAMQTRIEAMVAAVATVQPALEKFYGLLTDEQKERITALGQEQRRGRNAGALDPGLQLGAGERDRFGRPPTSSATCVRPKRNALASLRCRMPAPRRPTCSRPPARPRSRSRRRHASPRSASGSTPCCKPSRPCRRRSTTSMDMLDDEQKGAVQRDRAGADDPGGSTQGPADEPSPARLSEHRRLHPAHPAIF